MSRDRRLREFGKCRDEFPRGTFTGPQEVENPAAVGVRNGCEDRVVDFFLKQYFYDQEVEGSWLIEKGLPSGSEKVAEIPQAYSSG